MNPCLWDACAQVLWHALPDAARDSDSLYLPVAIDSARIGAETLPAEVWSHATVAATPGGGESLRGDVRIHDRAGVLVGALEGIALRPVPRAALASLQDQSNLYEVAWVREDAAAATQPAPGATGDRAWLVLADRAGVGEACAARLRALGATCAIRFSAGTATGDALPWSADALRAAMREAVGERGRLAGVIHCWNLDVPDGCSMDDAALEEHWRIGCGSLLSLAQSLLLTPTGSLPPVFVFTRGAQGPDDRLSAPLQAAALGLARTLALEHAELTCVRVDLDPDDRHPDQTAFDALGRVEPDETAIRSGVRFGRRLRRLPPEFLASAPPRRLEIDQRGAFDQLHVAPMRRLAPGHGEVEIAVRAAGLNFRDVLNALGTYPGPPGPLGDECAGVVAAVGPGVEEFSPGDDVIAVAPASLATHVTARARLTAPKPLRLTFAEAGSSPIVFLTAEYALGHKARLLAGERILIHAAAGGVGLAAVQVAQHAGATILATAGSERKREWLRQLGVRHVFDSRSTSFAGEIASATGGAGVHVVLNSLAGDAIPASLGLLAKGGRFIEIGRTGIWTAEQVAAERPDVAYEIVFLGDLFENEPDVSRRLLAAVREALDRGLYRPLPLRTWPLAHAADAFRFMAQARHIGKLAVVPGRDGAVAEARAGIRADRSYIVTGGMGALGLQAVRDLVDAGARHLVLAGRSAPGSAASGVIDELTRAGAAIEVVRADVSRRDDVADVVRAAARRRPIGGVVHAAGIVRDASFLQQDLDRLLEVMRSKVAGARHLHELTLDQPIDFFVLFSSAAGLFGSAGQANYTAANAVLDAFALWRQALGLPAVAIGWGPWSDGGMATVLGEREQARLTSQGWRPFSPREARGLFRALCASRAAAVSAFSLAWPQYLRQFRRVPAILAAFADRQPEPAAAPAPPLSMVDQVSALPASARQAALAAHIARQVARVLGVPGDHLVDQDLGLRDRGLDSLMAIELRNLLQTDFDRPLPATLAFDYPTVDAIAAYLVETLGFVVERPAAEAPAAGADDLASIQSMSDAEAEALLGAELDALDGLGRER